MNGRYARANPVPASQATAEPEACRISGPASLLLGWSLAGLINGVYLAGSHSPGVPRIARVVHHFYDAGHFIALGLFFAGMCGAFLRWGQGRTKTAIFAFTCASIACGALALPPDLTNMSVRLAGAYGPRATKAILVGSTVLVSLGVPLAYMIGRQLARLDVRWIGVAAGFVLFGWQPVIRPGSYHGAHLFLAIASVVLFAASLAGAVIPVSLRRPLGKLAHPTLHNAIMSLSAAVAAASLARTPPPSITIELLRNGGSVVPHFLYPLLHKPTPLRTAAIPTEMKPWFVDRTNHPPIPPSTPYVAPPNPIVLLLTIDAARADVIMSDKYVEKLPTLGRFRQQSIQFMNARAAAAGTQVSFMSLFTSTYYSQQYWTPDEVGSGPRDDEHPRLQELLTRQNITTVTFIGARQLSPFYGVTRGFSETKMLVEGETFVFGETLTNSIFERLEKVDESGLFLFAHYLDAHDPYDRGDLSGSQFDRYVSELSLVDKQLGRLVEYLETPRLRDRAIVIIAADHGEAFGEHGLNHHSSTVYDELLRVPLLIWQANATRMQVREPVTLIDLSPTILELFRVPIPGHFMGESLVPFLRGQTPKLSRPILAEARLKQALVLPNGHKVILDNRLNTVELYDLNEDPKELHSLADDAERVSDPLSLVQQFYETYRLRKPGYSPPYRIF